jgi:hypothetical protein
VGPGGPDDPAGCDRRAHSGRHCFRSEGRTSVFGYFHPGTAVGGSERRAHTRPGWRSLGRKRRHRAAGSGGMWGGGRPGSRNASSAQRSVSLGSPAVRRDGVKRGPCLARRRGTMSAAGRGDPPAATSSQPPIVQPNGANPWAVTIPCQMAQRHFPEWTAGGPDQRGRDVQARHSDSGPEPAIQRGAPAPCVLWMRHGVGLCPWRLCSAAEYRGASPS